MELVATTSVPSAAAESSGTAFVSLLSERDLLTERLDQRPQAIVVHLHSASHLPALVRLNRSNLSPYAVIWLSNPAGEAVGSRCTWSLRLGTRDPVWNSAQDLRLPPMTLHELKRSLLHVELWDHDSLLQPNEIGKVDVPLLTLLSDGTHIPVPISCSALSSSSAPTVAPDDEPSAASQLVQLLKKGMHTIAEGSAGAVPPASSGSDAPATGDHQSCTVQLRLVRRFPQRKTLYLVRHGESEWNRGQAKLDLATMYSQVDHPLSAEGRKQADALAATLARVMRSTPGDGGGEDGEATALRELCKSDLVLCSPLTRALQTCVLALGDVLRQQGTRVVLAPNARERINPGAVDSIGTAIGAEAVRERLLTTTTEIYDGNTPAAAAALDGLAYDDSEVRSQWWSSGVEGKEAVNARLDALLRQVQFCDSPSVVLVGHSHLFRELLRVYMNPSVAQRSEALAAQLKSKKLSNCGVARLELDFGESGGSAPIVGVQLLAGTTLV